MNDYLMIGEVLKPQGIHGEAKIKSYAADLNDFCRWTTLYRKQDETYLPVPAKCSRVHDGFAYVTLEGCTTPQDVEKLRGTQLYIDRDHAMDLAEDEVYISDLIGCQAIDEQGQVIGTLTDVLQHGAVDVYVFKTPKGSMMAPALKEVFPTVDVVQGRITVNSQRLDEVAVRED